MAWGDSFKPGDRVTVHSHYSGIQAITTVESVGKRKLKLADGSEWAAGGDKAWGNTDRWYTGPTVHHFRPADEETFWRQRAVARLGNTKWGNLTTDVLRAVIEALKKEPGK